MFKPVIPINEGDVYGRLTVVDASRRRAVVCRCSCGNEKVLIGSELFHGRTTSCGCYRRERIAKAMYGLKHGAATAQSDHRYQAWGGIRQRCLNPADKCWHHYGGRGIKMHEAWQNDPVAFITWLDEHLGPRPEGYSIDRIDNDGHYEPGNLRWASASQQRRNQRGSLSAETIEQIRNDPRVLRAIAEDHGISHVTVWNIKRRGRSSETESP